MADPNFLALVNGDRLAYHLAEGSGPGILWLGGFHSDMRGTKAEAVADWATRRGRASLRFDYFGHGQSSGDFCDGTISHWRDNALAVLDRLVKGPQILIASSMGGWIAMLLAKQRPGRIAGLLLIAPAADFTEVLMWQRMPEEVRRQLVETGSWLHRPENDEAYPITRGLIEDGRNNLVLNSTLEPSYPVRILHGMADTDVPWQHGLKLAETIKGDVTFTLVQQATHRMSRPSDLKLIERTLDGLVEDIPC
jgi:pimeloyl-ACP methyl ester carboxylesterase